jgi:hypothetical protein
MYSDLDTLCTVVCRTAEDLLPEAKGNTRGLVTDVEIVTLCVAQTIMGIPRDRSSWLQLAQRSSGFYNASCLSTPLR